MLICYYSKTVNILLLFFSFFTVTSFRHFKEKLYVVCFANIKEEINISKKILSLLLFLKNSIRITES